jgi:hypothetical protein
MSSAEWYYAHAGQQSGPISAADLKMLAVIGQLAPEDLVWRDGMSEWIPARKVRGLFGGEAAAQAAAAATTAPAAAPTPAAFEPSTAVYERSREDVSRHLVDVFLDLARAWFSPSFVHSTAVLFTACGHNGLHLAMLLVAGLGIALAIMGQNIGDAVLGLAAVAVLVVLQYAARRMGGALERLNRATPVRMTSLALPDCLAMLGAVAGVVSLVGLTLLAVQSRTISLVLPGMAAFIVWWYAALAAVNAQTLGVTVSSEASVREESLGLLALGMKIAVRLAPVLFGVGVGWGILKTAVAYALLFVKVRDAGLAAALLGGELPTTPAALPLRILAARTVYEQAVTILVAAAAAPLLIYVLFLVGWLGLDVIRAVVGLDEAEGQGGNAEE